MILPAAAAGVKSAAASLMLSVFLLLPTQAAMEIRFENGRTFRVAHASPEMVNVYVDAGGSLDDVPALSGERRQSGDDVVFEPRYPLGAGLRYTVVVRIAGRPPVSKTFETPKADLTPTTSVEQIYPSANRLPENQLKFYIHFSAAMSRGDAYQRIHLLEESGRPVEMPFLELEQELWDMPGQRLTLFFDPGRIKRDVLPNQEIGPSILAGRSYTLVIDERWKDAEGRPLKGEMRKHFTVADADRKPLDLRTWNISPPQAASRNPLTVDFPEPLDHALMLRQFEVLDAAGKALEGSISVERDETRWVFTPSQAWIPGVYGLRVGTIISDLAGNMIDRPFEVDRFDTVTAHVARETRVLPFTIR